MTKKARINRGLSREMTVEQLDVAFAAWARSPEGQEKLQHVERVARRAADKVLSDAKVDAEQLRRPVTL